MTDEPITEEQKEVCSQCKGLKYIEYEHGLIRLPCKACRGTSKQEIAPIVEGGEEYVFDTSDGPIDITGVGSANADIISEDSSKPKLPKKRKARKKAK